MPPRRILRRTDEVRQEENIPQPPLCQDASAYVLAGMARFFEQHVGDGARVRPEPVYERFRWMHPDEFHGTTDPFVAEGWIRSLEGDASLWWEGAERGVNMMTLTWEEFKRVFYDKYFTSDVRSRLKREFMSLRQGDWTVAEFVQKFDRGCHFVPLIANDAAEKLRHFLDGLKPTIRRDVMLSDPIDYTTAVAKAFRAEQSLNDIDWEMQRKRNRARQANHSNNKPYTGSPKQPEPPKPQGQPPRGNVPKADERPLCKECNRPHSGKCMWGTYKCFNCGELGHKMVECTKPRQPMTGRVYVMQAAENETEPALH
ncbi:uncharacterized protein LOC142538638 [Primulina tabacum]|uniref:uncharacterized protein LOC142538638 n=1 Tax=Primulina tabacum TaxID=48773 RepID=UPI003F59800F